MTFSNFGAIKVHPFETLYRIDFGSIFIVLCGVYNRLGIYNKRLTVTSNAQYARKKVHTYQMFLFNCECI